ncbi:hypothetical protein AAFP32_12135 [Brevibacterium sp. CBA3109]|uniref:Centromere-binding protein ParB C-terminal domain-containing protein n=1 Tax=Brevibacterium koreense TaxID=3140787 RepID=A0AAU7UI40_9MICO
MSMREQAHRDIDTSTPTVEEAALYWQWGGHMWQAPERFDRFIAKVKADALREAASKMRGHVNRAREGERFTEHELVEHDVEHVLNEYADRIEEEA